MPISSCAQRNLPRQKQSVITIINSELLETAISDFTFILHLVSFKLQSVKILRMLNIGYVVIEHLVSYLDTNLSLADIANHDIY